MSANLRFYSAGFIDGSLNDDAFGSLVEPHKEIALTADTVRAVQEVSVAIGEKLTIWAYSASRPYFDLAWLSIVGDGYLEVAMYSDAPTSSTDPTPLATCKSWSFTDLSCHAPCVFTSDEVTVNPVLGDNHSDNAGEPLKWADAGTVAGRIYKIMVHNPAAATSAVRLRYVVVY